MPMTLVTAAMLSIRWQTTGGRGLLGIDRALVFLDNEEDGVATKAADVERDGAAIAIGDADGRGMPPIRRSSKLGLRLTVARIT